MKTESVDDITNEIMRNANARCAYEENTLRRKLARTFDEARRAGGFTVRTLAEAMETSPSQVQRLLHREVGGSLTLRTIIRAADILGLAVGIHLRPRDREQCVVTQFGEIAWTESRHAPSYKVPKRVTRVASPPQFGGEVTPVQTPDMALAAGAL